MLRRVWDDPKAAVWWDGLTESGRVAALHEAGILGPHAALHSRSPFWPLLPVEMRDAVLDRHTATINAAWEEALKTSWPPLPLGIERTMYHITPVDRWPSIKETGLCPSERRAFVYEEDFRPIFLAMSSRVALKVAATFVEEAKLSSFEAILLEVKVAPQIILYPDPDYFSIPPVSYMSAQVIAPEKITPKYRVFWKQVGEWQWQQEMVPFQEVRDAGV